jgi:hypothetical protein
MGNLLALRALPCCLSASRPKRRVCSTARAGPSSARLLYREKVLFNYDCLGLPPNSGGGEANPLYVLVERAKTSATVDIPYLYFQPPNPRWLRKRESTRPLRTKSPQGRCQHTLGERKAPISSSHGMGPALVLFDYSYANTAPTIGASFPQGICWLESGYQKG